MVNKKTLDLYFAELRRVEKEREQKTVRKINKICKELMKDLVAYLAEYYAEFGNYDGILTMADLQRKSQYARFLEEVVKIADFKTPLVSETVLDTVQKTYSASYNGMLVAVKKATNGEELAKAFKGVTVQPRVIKRAVENPISGLTLPDTLERNRQNIIYEIKRAVNTGLVNGDRYGTTIKRVQKVLVGDDKQGGYYAKSANIVRTESHRVQEGGLSDCAKDISDNLDGSGYVYTATWRTMKDERVRPQKRVYTSKGWKTYTSKNGANHQRMEGKIIQVGDVFDLGGGITAECPGNSGDAKNDCNCRCFLEYALMTVDEFLSKGGKLIDK